MATDVPYQAYKSKRHLHTVSSVSTSEIEPKLTPANVNGSSIRRLSFQPPISFERIPSPTLSTFAATTSASSPQSTELHLDASQSVSSSPRHTPSRFRHVPFRTPQISTQSTNTAIRPSPLASHRAVTLPEPPILPSPVSTSILHFTPPTLPFQSPNNLANPSRENTPSPIPPADVARIFPSSNSCSPITALQPLQGQTRRILMNGPAPYRPGYQPRGIVRDRTDDYLMARALVRKEGQVERQRLERRLEKIMRLHFSHEKPKPRPPSGLRESLQLKIDFAELKAKGANNLWRSVLETRLSHTSPQSIREAEQAIVPWQSDSEVPICPICSSSFHPLTNRKHHCRTCGRVICSLPIKPPARPRPCSILFVVDASNGCIEEVAEGVDYGVRRRNGQDTQAEDKFLKGVRICQDCRPVLLRKQYELESRATPLYARLYEEMINLEHEIEGCLSQYEELLSSAHLLPRISTMREEILNSLADYETLAKEIQLLPVKGHDGISQERVQKSIAVRAGLFLQKKMLPLKIPISGSTTKETQKITNQVEDSTMDHDSGDDLASKLQPLMEQEAILESFIDEAKARRKFDDVLSLSKSLKEIQSEIKGLVQLVEN